MSKFPALLGLLLLGHFLGLALGQEPPNVFLTAAKSVPRIGRSNKGNSEFEKFFLKASKSVPRIGRRNENQYVQYDETDKDINEGKPMKYPTWSEIAERYEYEPELFNPQYLLRFEEELGDDRSMYDWEKVRVKRRTPAKIIPSHKYI